MWQLITVTDTEWIQDNSGYYILINWINENTVRLDVMDMDDFPVVSFQGQADNVRKYYMQCCVCNPPMISLEHAAYIGAELAKCALLQNKYVQD